MTSANPDAAWDRLWRASGAEETAMNDFTICYDKASGKLKKGIGCSEDKEQFIGTVSEEVLELPGISADGDTVFLDGFSFETSADIAMAVPDGTKIVFKGDNFLSVRNDKPDANVGVLYASGDLTLEGSADSSLTVSADTEQGFWSRAVCARAGDLTVDSGKVIARGGTSRKSCGLYAGGHLWIDTGEKGKITINGGELDIIAKTNAVRAAEGRLTLAAGAAAENVKETIGETGFKGDCLTAEDPEKPVRLHF